MVSPIPENYHTATPYLVMKDAAAAIDFYKKVFGAEEKMRLADTDGKVMHAELKIGNSTIMLADEFPEMGIEGPKTVGAMGVSIMLYVEDSDAVFNLAIESGALERRPLADQFYGDRSGTVEDPYGHIWSIASRIEDVTPEEVQKRFDDWIAERG